MQLDVQFVLHMALAKNQLSGISLGVQLIFVVLLPIPYNIQTRTLIWIVENDFSNICVFRMSSVDWKKI